VNLVNVLDSELREEALRRWEIAREVARRVDGVIYGSMAAMVTEGLPRLPKDVDIAVNWNLDKFLEWFKKFEQESWFEVEFIRQPPSIWKHGGPRYTLLLWEEDYRFFVNLALEHVEPSKEIDGVKLRFDRAEYLQQKKRKILEGNPTILDLLDLLWFEGEEAWDFIDLLPSNAVERIAKSWGKYIELVPRENQATIEEILRNLRIPLT